MAHMLAKLRGVKPEVISHILAKDAREHAAHGLFLEHLWQNADDVDEVQFLFRIDGIEQARAYVNGLHAAARRKDPNANLPDMTYLSNH
jgi:hypothetical protein